MLLTFTCVKTDVKHAISAAQISLVSECPEGILVTARVDAGFRTWAVAETLEQFCARAEASLIDARTTFTGKLPKKRVAKKKAVVKKVPARAVALKKAVAKVKAPVKKKAAVKKKAPAKVKKK